jgi:hypothetical protein
MGGRQRETSDVGSDGGRGGGETWPPAPRVWVKALKGGDWAHRGEG